MNFWTVLIVLIISTAAVDIFAQPQEEFFSRVPVDELHTMRVWEDGSYEIVYKDDTSETGCLPQGLCND